MGWAQSNAIEPSGSSLISIILPNSAEFGLSEGLSPSLRPTSSMDFAQSVSVTPSDCFVTSRRQVLSDAFQLHGVPPSGGSGSQVGLILGIVFGLLAVLVGCFVAYWRIRPRDGEQNERVLFLTIPAIANLNSNVRAAGDRVSENESDGGCDEAPIL